MADVGVPMDELRSSKRSGKISQARVIISFLAVNRLGVCASEVARKLSMSGMGVGKCVDRAKKKLLCCEIRSLFNWYDTQRITAEYLQ